MCTPFLAVGAKNIKVKLKLSLEEYQKAVMRGETMKSGMADHVWRKKSSLQLL